MLGTGLLLYVLPPTWLAQFSRAQYGPHYIILMVVGFAVVVSHNARLLGPTIVKEWERRKQNMRFKKVINNKLNDNECQVLALFRDSKSHFVRLYTNDPSLKALLSYGLISSTSYIGGFNGSNTYYMPTDLWELIVEDCSRRKPKLTGMPLASRPSADEKALVR